MKAEKDQANRMQNQESQIKIDKNQSQKTNERHVNGSTSQQQGNKSDSVKNETG